MAAPGLRGTYISFSSPERFANPEGRRLLNFAGTLWAQYHIPQGSFQDTATPRAFSRPLHEIYEDYDSSLFTCFLTLAKSNPSGQWPPELFTAPGYSFNLPSLLKPQKRKDSYLSHPTISHSSAYKQFDNSISFLPSGNCSFPCSSSKELLWVCEHYSIAILSQSQRIAIDASLGLGPVRGVNR